MSDTRINFLTDYDELVSQAESLTEGVPHLIANLANIAALIYDRLGGLNWAGFYIAEGELLVLGPFQGKPACIEIPYDRGVCGTTAGSGETQLVRDVHQFEGHIACDSASNSEIVIPLYNDGRVFGVLDIDSPYIGRFTEEDREGLERVAGVVERAIAQA